MLKSRIIKVRVSEEAYAEIVRAAAIGDTAPSAYIRAAALKAARTDNKYEAA